jgi:hypothetical protein
LTASSAAEYGWPSRTSAAAHIDKSARPCYEGDHE